MRNPSWVSQTKDSLKVLSYIQNPTGNKDLQRERLKDFTQSTSAPNP